uniref:Ribosomal protein S8 n=1 Tax=Babesia orientalis TaxID=273649 RepID=A0A0M4MT92_9APIC|nr:ribosomal protein S8 [Babesia orientalis]ALE29370.1 ribosomal protein S8 [Babesia orientalis]
MKKLNIQNKKLLEYIYKKCLLLNYISYYKKININNMFYKFEVHYNNIYYVKNFYKISNYIYIKYSELKRINKNLHSGVLLLSTSMGILTNAKAEMLKLGGVLICYIS